MNIYLKQIAEALEVLSGTSGAEENMSIAGYLTRIQEAAEVLADGGGSGQPSLLLSYLDELADDPAQTSELTAAGGLDGTELVHLVDSAGSSVKLTLDDLKTFVNTDPSVAPSSEPYRGARVRRTSDQAIANNTATVISWQAEDRDTDGLWSVGVPTKFVIPAGVTKIELAGNGIFASNATGQRQAYFTKNGATVSGSPNFSGPGLSGASIRFNLTSDVIDVVEGDEFEFVAFQTSGGSLNMTAGTSLWFAIKVIEAS